MVIPDRLIADLDRLLGDRLTSSESIRSAHGRDESFHRPRAPDLVAFANSNDEVQEIVRRCAEHTVPIIPFGTGTSLEGHVVALHGGVSLDVSGMRQILEINVEDLDCRVQAGVTHKQLNTELRQSGLFFPVDPGADASLGGMAATRASGTNAVRYGTMKENLLGLTVVLPDGDLVRTGGRARKSASGLDLTRLLCGSEGTLGVITEVQLKLFGVPEAVSVGVCSFSSLKSAVDAVITTIQMGIPVARIELLDEVQMRAINDYSNLDYPEQPSLFFEFHGSETSVAEQSARVGEIVDMRGATDFVWSTKQEEQNRLWQARHDAYYAAKALKPGAEGWPTDVCVPISRLAECIEKTREDIERAGMMTPIVGHVGDGNFHLLLLVHPDNQQEMDVATGINDRLVRRAIDMGGTCTGEHGIGYGKLKYLEMEHGSAVELMRKIKRAIDPHNIMNPGKLIP